MNLLRFIALVTFFYCSDAQNETVSTLKIPTVFIVSLIRNKAHTLPYFLSCLENLNYPKSKLTLLFQSDHNEDNSIELINLWLNRISKEYNKVLLHFEKIPKRYENESSPNDWTKERTSHVIKLKEKALQMAQKLLTNFIFFLDADVFLTNRDTLFYLTLLKLPIVSPMLFSDGRYSNFVCGTPLYKKIYTREKLAVFEVRYVHSAVLINLNMHNKHFFRYDPQKYLSYEKLIKQNSIYTLNISAISTYSLDTPKFISNSVNYGYILKPLRIDDEITRDYEQLQNIKLNIINDLDTGIEVKKEFEKYIFYPAKNKLSLDHIYVVNLERRADRRKKLELSFKELGLDVEYFPAIDGETLNLSMFEEMGIKFLPLNEKLYYKHPMTMGEVGCFLSHYKIWKKIIARGQKEVLIIEDDIRFEPNFTNNAYNVLNEVRKLGNWDLLYFGREALLAAEETWVNDAKNLVHVKYSYGSLGYVITLKGANKLIDNKPLEKLVPVDEFLSIIMNQHPYSEWNEAFKTKNLLAYSAEPLLLVHPYCNTNQVEYTSDTEDSKDRPINVHCKIKNWWEEKKSIKLPKVL